MVDQVARDGSPRLITAEEWAAARREAIRSDMAAAAAAGGSIGAVLLPYQGRLVATAMSAMLTVCEKSRRTGATWGVGAGAVLTSGAEKAAGGMDTFYVGYNLDMAREFIDTCAEWARAFDQACGEVDGFLFEDGPDNAIAAFRIRFASGYEILALPSRPRSLRGRQGFVIIDEAAFHDDLEGVLKAAFALLIWGGRVLVISTHLGEENAFYKLCQDIRSGAQPGQILRFDFDDALRDGLYRRRCLVKGEPWTADGEAAFRADILRTYRDNADEELFCIASKASGAWLSAPLIEACSRTGVPVLRLQRDDAFTFWPAHLREADMREWCERELLPLLKLLDPTVPHYGGADLGRVSDLSVLWPLALQRTMRRTTPFVVEMKNVPFDCQGTVIHYVFDRLPRFSGAGLDATGLGAATAEAAAQRYGRVSEDELLVDPVKFSTAWYLTEMPPLKRAFEDAMVEVPLDGDLHSDLRLFRTVDGVVKLPAIKSGERKDRHGDGGIALALAYAASRKRAVAYGYTGARELAAETKRILRDEPVRGRGLW